MFRQQKSLYIGKRETYGISRALVKFPGLNLNDLKIQNKL